MKSVRMSDKTYNLTQVICLWVAIICAFTHDYFPDLKVIVLSIGVLCGSISIFIHFYDLGIFDNLIDRATNLKNKTPL